MKIQFCWENARSHKELVRSFSSIRNALAILTFEPERKVLTLTRTHEVGVALNATPFPICGWAQ